MNQSVLEVLRKEGMVGGMVRGQVRGPFSVCNILLSSSGSELGGGMGDRDGGSEGSNDPTPTGKQNATSSITRK